jgi:hypothetical protein
MKWQPYKDYENKQEFLPIVEPPCRECEHFRPVRLYNGYGNFSGVRLCHGESMFADFSCYKEKE